MLRRGIGARLLVALAILMALPALASAHASLTASNPEDGQIVPSTPKSIVLSFTEPVETSLGAIQVFDGEAREVAVGELTKVGTDRVTATIPAELADGTYTVSWRVLSADGHPIDGAFVFHVGAPGANPGGVTVSREPSSALSTAAAIARFLNVVLVIALIGGIIALLFLFAGRTDDVERRMWHVVAGLGFALSIAAGATVLLQAAIVNGSGVAAAAQGDVLSAVLQTRFGKVRLAQLIIAEIIAIGAVWAVTVRSRWFKWALGALAGVLAVTPGLSGHAGVNGAPAVIADTGHVLAASVWVGGLGAIAMGMVMVGREHRADFARSVFPRFSTMALVSVVVLLIAGTIGGFANIDRASELWETTYGRLLLVKIAIALILIGLGAVSRAAVRRVRQDDDTGFTRLRRTIPIEIGLMLVVLGFTSVLIDQPPGKASGATAAASASRTVTVGDLDARLVVTPSRTGSNTIRVELTKDAAAVEVDEVTVTAAPASGAVAPFKLSGRRESPGRYAAGPLQAAVAGAWTFDIDVRRGDFDLQRGTVTVPIGKAR